MLLEPDPHAARALFMLAIVFAAVLAVGAVLAGGPSDAPRPETCRVQTCYVCEERDRFEREANERRALVDMTADAVRDVVRAELDRVRADDATRRADTCEAGR